MTTPLETHYRRLLGAYPQEHRRTYETEMIGVLMDGARPGQRFPALADAADLLVAGVRARLGRGRQALRTDAWRDAAAVVGLLGAVVLTAVAGRRLIAGTVSYLVYDEPMRPFGLDGALVFDVALRSIVWLAVVVAALAGARRLAAFYAVVATLVEFAALAWWYPAQPDRLVGMAWLPVLTLLVGVSLAVAVRGRSASAVMGRGRLALAVLGTALPAATHLMNAAGLSSEVSAVLNAGRAGWVLPSIIQVVLAVPLLWALWTLVAPVRRRVLVAAVPVLIMPPLIDAVTGGFAPTAGQIVLMIAVPPIALFWAIQALNWRERNLTTPH